MNTTRGKYYNILFITMAISMPFQMVSLSFSGFNVSIDRFLLIVLFALFPLFYRNLHHQKSDAFILFLGFWLMISVFATAFTNDGINDTALELLPRQIQCYIIFLISAFIFKNNYAADKTLSIILGSWILIFTFYSVYSLIYYYIIGGSKIDFPILGVIGDTLHSKVMIRLKRLFVPTSTSPNLGVIAGFISLWYLMLYSKVENKKHLIAVVTSAVIMILTLSRGPILSFIIGFIAFSYINWKYKLYGTFKISIRTLALFTLLIYAFLYYQSYQSSGGYGTSANRLLDITDGGSESRHLSLKLLALNMFYEGGFIQKIFGNGIYSIRQTLLGDSAFSSYLNLLAEMGLFSFVPFIIVIFTPLMKKRSLPMNLTELVKNSYPTVVLAIFVAISHIFYKFETLELLWLLSGYLFGKSRTDRVYFVANIQSQITKG